MRANIGAVPQRVLTLVRVALAVGVTWIVYRTAWVSDDAIITFRYVWNWLHGYGAVFNVGERVQGYTHPLWFALLSLVTLVTRDEVYAATGLSLALTLATILVLGARLERFAKDRHTALFVTALLAVILAASDSWRSFQTSGLEGALSTLLVMLFVVTVLDDERASPWRILLSGSVLVTCRPDFALLVLPVGVLTAWTALRAPEGRLRAAAALSPLVSFVVAWIYYGDPLPNTGAAKLGIFTFGEGVHQGGLYFRDWIVNEPITALSAFALLFFGAARLRARHERLLLAGIVTYAVYLVVVGGDFMRGRLLLPVFVASCTFGGVALARTLGMTWSVKRYASAVVGLTLLAVASVVVAPGQTRSLDFGIVNERVFYVPERSLAAYSANRQLYNDDHFEFIAAYLKTCGKVAIASRTPGWAGYYLGPDLTIVDTLGLTDRFIARLPRENLRYHPPRPGHPYKRIPLAYLARRRVVSILPDWQKAMRDLDCTLVERLKPIEDDPSLAP